MMASIKITDGKGVQILFDNGYCISIQIGPGNYCDNYNMDAVAFYTVTRPRLPASRTAEIAVLDKNGNMTSFGEDTVRGYVPINEVLDLINETRNKE
jgi:hypothetical protein